METTAYALLAQMAVGRLKLAGPIVTWLTNQRDPLGGFVSTQVSVAEVEPFSHLATEISWLLQFYSHSICDMVYKSFRKKNRSLHVLRRVQ